MQSDDVFYKNVAAFQNTQDGFHIACLIRWSNGPYVMVHNVMIRLVCIWKLVEAPNLH